MPAAASTEPRTASCAARRIARTDLPVAALARTPATPDVDTTTRRACQSADPDLFFAESPADLEQAKNICRRCPARRGCLADALGRREPWGVWGGEILVDGVVTAHKRPRGRPRKKDRESGLVCAPGNAP